jgi:hypothetical protein
MQQQPVAADFRNLAIDQLRESPTNPRRSCAQEKLQKLYDFVPRNKIVPASWERPEVVEGKFVRFQKRLLRSP